MHAYILSRLADWQQTSRCKDEQLTVCGNRLWFW